MEDADAEEKDTEEKDGNGVRVARVLKIIGEDGVIVTGMMIGSMSQSGMITIGINQRTSGMMIGRMLIGLKHRSGNQVAGRLIGRGRRLYMLNRSMIYVYKIQRVSLCFVWVYPFLFT